VAQVLSEVYYFSRRVADEIARARRSGTRFSIVLFTALPAPGELPEIACVTWLPTILRHTRETDTVCRVTRDTIAVLLIDAAAEGAQQAAARLSEQLGDDANRWQVSVLRYPENHAHIEGYTAA
jgi:hypothetical protein